MICINKSVAYISITKVNREGQRICNVKCILFVVAWGRRYIRDSKISEQLGIFIFFIVETSLSHFLLNIIFLIYLNYRQIEGRIEREKTYQFPQYMNAYLLYRIQYKTYLSIRILYNTDFSIWHNASHFVKGISWFYPPQYLIATYFIWLRNMKGKGF